MNNKYFFYKVRKMRALQREYFKTRDKQVLQRSKAIEKDIDEEITRVDALVVMKAQLSYELMNINETMLKVGKEWYYEHIKASLDYFFFDKQHIGEEYIEPNGFCGDCPYPTLVIKDIGDMDEDDMLEFRILGDVGKYRLVFLQRLKG